MKKNCNWKSERRQEGRIKPSPEGKCEAGGMKMEGGEGKKKKSKRSTNGETARIAFAGKARLRSCHRWIMGVLLHNDDSCLGQERTIGT